MWPNLRKQLFLELAQLQQLLDLYRPLIEQCRQEEPSAYEMGALAAALQSFYNGVENLFRRILKELGSSLPKGEDWHQRLLQMMTSSTAKRPRVISEELHESLLEYLQFRHLFRSSYLFQLRWNKMSPLIFGIEVFFELFYAEIEAFAVHMDALESGTGPDI